MRILVCKNYEEMSKKAAQMILSQITLKPNAVLGLATGSTPVGMYKNLVDMYNHGIIDFSEVTTFKVTRRVNDQGVEVEDRVETFRGMFGVVYLNKNSMMNIGIYGDSRMRRFRRDRIEMDSTEFEQYYDLVTDDKIRAMRVFTSDLLEKFIDVKKAHKNGVEVKIEWDKIYFRFRCGEIFEPPAFVNGLKKEYLKSFYNHIYYPLELLDKTVECLNEIHE